MVIALEVSAAMEGLPSVMATDLVDRLVDGLDPHDRFGLVTYDADAVIVHGVAPPPSSVELERSLQGITTAGESNLSAGWTTAGAVASTLPGTRHVVVLASGHADVGITDPDALAKYARRVRRRGLTTSVVGLGRDGDSAPLAAIAGAGGGLVLRVQTFDQVAVAAAQLLDVGSSTTDHRVLRLGPSGASRSA